MPVYRYQAVDKAGRNLSGVMPANDEFNLDEKLNRLGLWLTDAALERATAIHEDIAQRDKRWFRTRSAKQRREIIDFRTLMAFQLRVGVAIPKALEVCQEDCKDPEFRKILSHLQSDIESGSQFYECLAKYPKYFDEHFVSVIRAGELSAKMPETFDDLKEYLEWVEQIMNDIKQATIYPAIVSLVIMGFTVFLFTFIIPKFSALLRSVKVDEPFLTSVVFGVGDFCKNTWFIWLPLMLIVAIAIPILKRKSERFAFGWDEMKLRLPIFGELNQMLALSRFSYNLSILYRSGISIVQSLELCKKNLIGNKVVEKAVAEMAQDVKEGSTVSEAMHRHRNVFTAMLQRMVAMGESTGNLDKGLQNVTDYYNDVIPRKIKKVFAIAEPMLMLFLIFIVGCVALAIYLPIISLMGAIK